MKSVRHRTHTGSQPNPENKERRQKDSRGEPESMSRRRKPIRDGRRSSLREPLRSPHEQPGGNDYQQGRTRKQTRRRQPRCDQRQHILTVVSRCSSVPGDKLTQPAQIAQQERRGVAIFLQPRLALIRGGELPGGPFTATSSTLSPGRQKRETTRRAWSTTCRTPYATTNAAHPRTATWTVLSK